MTFIVEWTYQLHSTPKCMLWQTAQFASMALTLSTKMAWYRLVSYPDPAPKRERVW